MDVDLDYDGDPTSEQIMDIDAEEVRLSRTRLLGASETLTKCNKNTLQHALRGQI